MGTRARRDSEDRKAEALLRGHGLRCTDARVKVLRNILSKPRPRTHGEIAQALAHTGLDRVTVYRNLLDLAEAGLVSRTDLGDHVWRFESKVGRTDDEQHHPHFVCTDCGGIACLPVGSVKIVASRRVPKAVASKHVVVHLKGLCDRCA